MGTISANGEREIGELIARAMEKVGKEGVITVQVGGGGAGGAGAGRAGGLGLGAGVCHAQGHVQVQGCGAVAAMCCAAGAVATPHQHTTSSQPPNLTTTTSPPPPPTHTPLPTHTPHPQDGKTLENELDVVEGMRFDRGYISPYFVTDQKTMKAELENPLILVVEKKVSGLASILPVLEKVVQVRWLGLVGLVGLGLGLGLASDRQRCGWFCAPAARSVVPRRRGACAAPPAHVHTPAHVHNSLPAAPLLTPCTLQCATVSMMSARSTALYYRAASCPCRLACRTIATAARHHCTAWLHLSCSLPAQPTAPNSPLPSPPAHTPPDRAP